MTDHTYADFGWRTGTLEDRGRQIEQTLAIVLEPHSSLYRGDYYHWGGGDGGDLILQENFVEDDGQRTYSKHSEHLVLLFTSDLPPGFLERIAGIDGAEWLGEE
jgi:hypothetical protein